MSLRKKLWLAGIAVFLLLVAGGCYFYVSTIDWNQHKDKIAKQFSDVTGKKVVFEGAVSFTLLPSPYLQANNVKVYNTSGENKDKPLMVVKKLVANVSLPSVLSGDFEVKRMSLVEPEIMFELLEEGKVNWQSGFEGGSSIKNIDISLDSLTVEKAKVKFIDAKRSIDVTLENLNAEIIAQSVFGPYRIEGSYLKDNNPEGFAISLGQFSESFATSVNLALNQPAYETYLRFDGTVLLKNDAVNGNVVFESRKPVSFVNNNFKDYQLPLGFEQPLAVSAELNTSLAKIDLNNIVVKYGASAGAGNVLIPREYSEYGVEAEAAGRRKIEVAFDMTDLDLEPAAKIIKILADKYSSENAEFYPGFAYDVIADVRAVKSYYNNQTIRDFDISLDFTEDEVKLQSLNAVLPGDTDLKLKGSVYAVNEALTYNFETAASTADATKFLAWLGFDVPKINDATYKRGSVSFKLDGNLKTIKISPLEVFLDKTSLKGEAGIIRGNRNNVFLSLESDAVNFDNYVQVLPQEEQQKSFAERMEYRFKKLAVLNDFDMRANIKLGLGIYENIPFENMEMFFDLKNGNMEISNLQVNGVSGANINAKGKISGFGNKPVLDNLQYSVLVQDVVPLFNKLAVKMPDINLKDLKTWVSDGVISGDLEKFFWQGNSKIGNIDTAFKGDVIIRAGKAYLNGNLEVKAPDFIKMMNALNYPYSPAVFTLGMFAMKTEFVGAADKFKASKLNLSIGANNFQGAAVYDATGARPNVLTNLVVNKLELDRFMYKDAATEDRVLFRPTNTEKGDFIAKPFFDKAKIDYKFYNKFDLKGKFSFGSLSYKHDEFKDASFDVVLKDGVAKFSDIKALYNHGEVWGSLEANMLDKPSLKGNLEFSEQFINEEKWSGKKFGIRSGLMDGRITFDTSINSIEDMVLGLNAKLDFAIKKPRVKGWNLEAIRADLKTRDRSEGFYQLVSDNVSSGETYFEKVSGEIEAANSEYAFKNVNFESSNLKVNFQNKGSLNTWDMNANLEVRFEDLKNIPPFYIAMSGPMIAPQVVVNVADITKIYDSHWAKVAEDEKNAEMKRAENLKALMDKEQQRAQDLKDKLQKEVIVLLEEKSALAQDARIINRYNSLKVDVNKAFEDVQKILAAGTTIDFDESLPKFLSEENNKLEAAVNKLPEEINLVYAQDVKIRINDNYNKIANVYNEAKTKTAQYRDAYNVYPKRLLVIKTAYSPEQDNGVVTLKENIDNTLLTLDRINAKVMKDYIFMQNTSDWVKLEEFATDVKNMLDKSVKEQEVLYADIDALLKYMEQKVTSEENVFYNRRAEEEQQKKIEENTGKISVVSKAKEITVTRDIEEIEKVEEEIEGEKLPVLDFSGDKPKFIGAMESTDIPLEEAVFEEEVDRGEEMPAEEADENVPLLREIEGDSLEASGSIKRD